MKALPAALFSAVLMLFLQIFSFRFLLGSDVLSRAFQFLFYGPYLVSGDVLRFVRDSWGAPIPSTRSGGLPDGLELLLLTVNWLLCSLVLFAVWRWVSRRRAR